MAPSQRYKDYLKSDKWARKRQDVFAFYGKRCYACGKSDKILHCHHLSYAHLGNERLSELIPLCVPCHKELTKIYKSNRRRGLARVTMEYVKKKRATQRR